MEQKVQCTWSWYVKTVKHSMLCVCRFAWMSKGRQCPDHEGPCDGAVPRLCLCGALFLKLFTLFPDVKTPKDEAFSCMLGADTGVISGLENRVFVVQSHCECSWVGPRVVFPSWELQACAGKDLRQKRRMRTVLSSPVCSLVWDCLGVGHRTLHLWRMGESQWSQRAGMVFISMASSCTWSTVALPHQLPSHKVARRTWTGCATCVELSTLQGSRFSNL